MTLPRRRSGRGAPLMRSAATATSTAAELPGLLRYVKLLPEASQLQAMWPHCIQKGGSNLAAVTAAAATAFIKHDVCIKFPFSCCLSILKRVARLHVLQSCSHVASCACSGGRDPPAPRASQAEAVALQTLPDSVPNPTRLRISPSMAHIRYSGLPGLTSASSQQSGSHELEATLVEAAGGHPLQVSGRAQVTLQTRVSVSQTQAH